MRFLKNRRRGRVAAALALAVTVSLAMIGLSTTSAHANGLGQGYRLPAGAASNWIGSYKVAGGVAFCADPKKTWPGSSTYSGVKKTRTWKDSISGQKRGNQDVARVAWILFEYRNKMNRPSVAAAIDASIYALLSKGEYAFNKNLFNNRTRATGRGTEIRNLAKTMINDSAKYAGPYKFKVDTNKNSVTSTGSFKATATLTSKRSGNGLPNKKVTFEYAGKKKSATTNNKGVAKVSFKAQNGERRIDAQVGNLASDAVSYRTPNNAAAQRVLVRTGSTSLKDKTRINITKPDVLLNTRTSASSLQLGTDGTAEISDRVTVKGADSEYRATVTATLYGPFSSPPGRNGCVAANRVGSATATANGNGTVTVGPVTVDEQGYYTWVASVPAVDGYTAATHACGLTAETSFVGPPRAVPNIDTVTSAPEVPTGEAVHDNVTISGVELPCVDASGDPVLNPDGLACDEIVLTPEVPATPDLTGQWVDMVTATGCFDPRELTGLDLTDPAVLVDLYTSGVQLPGLDGSNNPDPLLNYWNTTGTQAECEAVVVVAGNPGSPEVTAEQAPDFEVTATAHLYGPYPSLDDATCAEDPYASVEFDVTGNGTVVTPEVTVDAPGVYTWVIDMPGNRYVEGVVTECGIEAETTLVKNEPSVRTQTSDFVTTPGSEIYDVVWVEGSAGDYEQTVVAELYGPYTSRDEMDCVDEPYATVEFDVVGDGEYITPTVTLEEAGLYTWVERFAEDDLNFEVITECGLEEETTLVQAQPELLTQTSDAEVKVGSEITDMLMVSGVVGEFEETAKANLYGPFASMDDLDCSVKPYATVRVKVTGNGEYVTPGVIVDTPGYYTWHEEFEGNELNAGFTHDCGLVEETTLVTRDEPKEPKTPDVPSGFTVPGFVYGEPFGFLGSLFR